MIRRASRECGVQSESCVVWRADYTAHGQGSSVMCARIHAFIFSLLAMMAFHPATALAQGSDPLFDAPWRAFGTGDFPTIRAAFFDVGDIDGDGDLDVVASLQMFSGPGISILRSNGDGTYAPQTLLDGLRPDRSCRRRLHRRWIPRCRHRGLWVHCRHQRHDLAAQAQRADRRPGGLPQPNADPCG